MEVTFPASAGGTLLVAQVAHTSKTGATLTDPYLLQRGAFATIADGAGEFMGVNAPWKMSGAPTSMQRDVPAIGAHRDEVLSRVLGLSATAIAALAEAGAFGSGKD